MTDKTLLHVQGGSTPELIDVCCHELCEWLADGCVKEQKRSRSRQLGQNMPPVPAGKLAYSLQGLQEVSLDSAPRRWSQERCRNCLAKVMGCLKVGHTTHDRGLCTLCMLPFAQQGRLLACSAAGCLTNVSMSQHVSACRLFGQCQVVSACVSLCQHMSEMCTSSVAALPRRI